MMTTMMKTTIMMTIMMKTIINDNHDDDMDVCGINEDVKLYIGLLI